MTELGGTAGQRRGRATPSTFWWARRAAAYSSCSGRSICARSRCRWFQGRALRKSRRRKASSGPRRWPSATVGTRPPLVGRPRRYGHARRQPDARGRQGVRRTGRSRTRHLVSPCGSEGRFPPRGQISASHNEHGHVRYKAVGRLPETGHAVGQRHPHFPSDRSGPSDALPDAGHGLPSDIFLKGRVPRCRRFRRGRQARKHRRRLPPAGLLADGDPP